jgi:hypothetical protein
MTRIIALALALFMIAPAAEAAGAAAHNVTKHQTHRSRAIVILLGKARPPHTRPRPHEHQPLHGARSQSYARGGAGGQAAFYAVAATMPFGSVNYEAKFNAKGDRLIWLDARVVDRLAALRGPGASYSDVMLRMATAKRE